MRRRPTLVAGRAFGSSTSANADITTTLTGRYRCVDVVLKDDFDLPYGRVRTVIDASPTIPPFRTVAQESRRRSRRPRVADGRFALDRIGNAT
jgi:hypothetical protein